MFSLFTDSLNVESSEEMSSTNIHSGKDSGSTYCPTPKRGVGERVGPIQGTTGSTAMPVYVPVMQPVESLAGTCTEPFVCIEHRESMVSQHLG